MCRVSVFVWYRLGRGMDGSVGMGMGMGDSSMHRPGDGIGAVVRSPPHAAVALVPFLMRSMVS